MTPEEREICDIQCRTSDMDEFAFGIARARARRDEPREVACRVRFEASAADFDRLCDRIMREGRDEDVLQGLARKCRHA